MSSKIYDYYTHTHAMFKFPQKPEVWEAWEVPIFILHHTGSRVYIMGCYSMLEEAFGMVKITSGEDTGYDDEGNCILSIPASWVSSYYTSEEAHQAERCLEADAQLLSYAR